ncbi:hypothetical protein GFK82_00001 [Candidatus Steffania adelgidicola]|nr:hypothetical protein GFK82_00001 [Candidatus Steffania adelgidicola]
MDIEEHSMCLITDSGDVSITAGDNSLLNTGILIISLFAPLISTIVHNWFC